MSTIFVGPYVRCVSGVVEQATRDRGCLNAAREAVGQVQTRGTRRQFCSSCGTPIESLNRTEVVEAVDRWRVGQEIQEALTWVAPPQDHKIPGLIYWVRNRTRDGDPTRSFVPGDGNRVLELMDNYVGLEIGLFRMAFEPELDILRRHYESADVQWGVICKSE